MKPPPSEDGRRAPFSAVVCTLNRPEQLHRTLEALRRQRHEFEVRVVDQSDEPDPELERLTEEWSGLSVTRDPGKGLSRARNIGWRASDAEWVVYVDDDCIPDPDWSEQLSAVIAEHPEAELTGCYVEDPEEPSGTHVSVSAFRPAEEREVRGRWTRPWHIGLGACHAVRRETLARLGGYDERLGPGAPDFPGCDDMDLNYRLLRGGGTACVTPRVKVLHEQWRTNEQLPGLFRGYCRAWGGFCAKYLRSRDIAGGLWLILIELESIARFLASGLMRRSRLRVSLTAPMTWGLISGMARGSRRRWSEGGPAPLTEEGAPQGALRKNR
jgi:GT2 family glycosyltransferase